MPSLPPLIPFFLSSFLPAEVILDSAADACAPGPVVNVMADLAEYGNIVVNAIGATAFAPVRENEPKKQIETIDKMTMSTAPH